jgi:hypothetical protein
MHELLLALALVAFSAEPQEIRREQAIIATVWPRASAPAREGQAAERTFYSSISPGEILGRIQFHDVWRDYRGQEVPAGIYTFRYAVQPILKDHAGTSRWRDFAIIGEQRDGHPWVMALVPPDEADFVMRLGDLRIGMVIDKSAESAF